MVQKLNISTQGQGIPLLFIHGWGLNSAIWQPLVEELKATYKISTIDLPGFGNNLNHLLETYDIANIAQEIANAIEQPSVIIGWSLGGLIANELAINYPAKVMASITVASSPKFVESEFWSGIKAPVLNSFHRQLSDNTERTIDGFLKIQAMGSPHLRDDIRHMRQLVMQLPMASKDTLDQSLTLLESSDYRDKLKSISQPFLRLYGRCDSLVPHKVIEQIDLLAPHSEKYIFEKASHAPFISHPIEFKEVLCQWLNRQSLL